MASSHLRLFAASMLLGVVSSSDAFGQDTPDVLGDALDFSGATLNLQRYSDFGRNARLNSIATQPASVGNQNIFLTNQNGLVYEIGDNGSGQGVTSTWFDYDAAIRERFSNTDGYALSGDQGQNGLQGVAFHPEFATNGKFYTSAMVTAPSDRSGFSYLGNTVGPNVTWEGVVAEWTVNPGNGQVDPNSYREVLRIQTPEQEHPLKLPVFDPYARPGDENYGLLFFANGDGDGQNNGVVAGRSQDLANAVGKFIRINPLEDTVNNRPYSVPDSNPFVNDPNALDEIYTSGHRNPHTYSFALDAEGNSHLLVGEIGQENIEEINLLQSGGDFGWSDREGTFIRNPSTRDYGLGNGVLSLPADDASLNDYVYPVAQYDHTRQGTGQAVASGFVIDIDGEGGEDGQFVFADFSLSTGHVYQAGLDELLAANTQLEDGESPDDLTQATIFRLSLTLDVDGDGVADFAGDTLQDVLDYEGRLPNNNRTDVRWGQGPNGEVFLTSKRTGEVYLVTNATASALAVAVPEPATFLFIGAGVLGLAGRRRRA